MTTSLKITCNYCPWTSYDEGERLDVKESLRIAEQHTATRHADKASKRLPDGSAA